MKQRVIFFLLVILFAISFNLFGQNINTVLINQLQLYGYSTDIYDSLAFLATGNDVYILNISDPANPVTISIIESSDANCVLIVR